MGDKKRPYPKLLLHIEFESLANANIVDWKWDISNEYQYEEVVKKLIFFIYEDKITIWRQKVYSKGHRQGPEKDRNSLNFQ